MKREGCEPLNRSSFLLSPSLRRKKEKKREGLREKCREDEFGEL